MVHWILSGFIHKGTQVQSFTPKCFIVNTFILLEVPLCYEVWTPLAPCCFTGKSTKQALSEYQVSKHTWHTLNAGPKLNKSSTISHSHTANSSQRNPRFLKDRRNHSFGPSVPQHFKRNGSKTMTESKNMLRPKSMQTLTESSLYSSWWWAPLFHLIFHDHTTKLVYFLQQTVLGGMGRDLSRVTWQEG